MNAGPSSITGFSEQPTSALASQELALLLRIKELVRLQKELTEKKLEKEKTPDKRAPHFPKFRGERTRRLNGINFNENSRDPKGKLGENDPQTSYAPAARDYYANNTPPSSTSLEPATYPTAVFDGQSSGISEGDEDGGDMHPNSELDLEDIAVQAELEGEQNR
ncbi:hypothetical protein QFC19_000776 [Naganishia cerealis]|uniref:Uncharacterized protein n=1 Tax=Naganishia cerealis TaxID=610337 RepID=A0ACC2WLP0_9TREE|nr:hypothetical protein QFC19_000776 [Naganishia cerealis]